MPSLSYVIVKIASPNYGCNDIALGPESLGRLKSENFALISVVIHSFVNSFRDLTHYF